VVLIDGGAGSGKTTLAELLRDQWPGTPPQLVGMDELYPGWNGLSAGSAEVPQVITGHGFLTWDWLAERRGRRHELDPQLGLIIEGCGAITAASKAAATLTIWLDAPEPLRRERALARDGDIFAPHWQDWARQEAAHWRINKPRELADLVITVE
jgi:adenylate kinase family enzyme